VKSKPSAADRQNKPILPRMRWPRQVEECAEPTRSTVPWFKLSVSAKHMFAATCQMSCAESLTERTKIRTGAGRATEINLIGLLSLCAIFLANAANIKIREQP
jgi:hypothetical protein